MRWVLPLLPLFVIAGPGCTDHDDAAPPLSIILAGGGDTIIGTYADGTLELAPRFSASFARADLALALVDDDDATDADALVAGAPLVAGEPRELAVRTHDHLVDRLLIVPDDTLPVTTAFGTCTWDFTTITHQDAGTVTADYWKRSSCHCTACWEQFGRATWHEESSPQLTASTH